MSQLDISGLMSLFVNGFFMLTAVYWPNVYGKWSRAVFTVNFIAVLMSFGGIVARGTI